MVALALIVILAEFAAGCSPVHEQPEFGEAPETTSPEETSSQILAALPAEDVEGDEIPELPRYPGSVRTGYESWEEGDLVFTRAQYLTSDELDDVREFYRDVFRSEGWTETDAEFSEGVWSFFVTRGEREANAKIQPRGPGTEVDIEFSEPRLEETITQTTSPTKATPSPKATSPTPQPAPSRTPAPKIPAPTPAPESAPAPPTFVPPAPAPTLAPEPEFVPEFVPEPAPIPTPEPVPVPEPAPPAPVPVPIPEPPPVPVPPPGGGGDDDGGEGDDGSGDDDGGGDD